MHSLGILLSGRGSNFVAIADSIDAGRIPDTQIAVVVSNKADAPGIVPPQREKMKTEMEALIYHFKIYTEGFAPPPGEVYQRVESPRGELGCFLASDGSPKPYRMRIRAPSFVNLQALNKMVEGRLIADVIASIGTLDIVLGEIDR